jgi:two-component system copper resistance phosphate regulon response regulator CusR
VRVLFAEDDRQLRAAVTRGLREASYAVDAVGDGVQAIAHVDEHEYDVVILDILMPGKDGIEVCRALRRAGHQVPILMLTALDAVERRIDGLDAGADDYLTKPFNFGELLARIRALTRRKGDVLAPALVVGDLEIDVLRRTARRGRREITLTNKEFAFLEHLARHAGRIVHRSELLAHIWDEGHNPFSNTLDVYASRLRRKIDEGEPVALFSTRRAVGYMLRDPAAPAASGEAPERQAAGGSLGDVKPGRPSVRRRS